MTAFGMPGVWTWASTEGWSQFYADSVATNHNAIGRGYETFGNHTAETVERVIDPDRRPTRARPVTEPDWYRTAAAAEEVQVVAARQHQLHADRRPGGAAVHRAQRPDMMRNFWRRGRNAVRAARARSPTRSRSPNARTIPRRLAAMINLLRAHGIEVSRAKRPSRRATASSPPARISCSSTSRTAATPSTCSPRRSSPPQSSEYPPYDDVAWALP
jgi:hypothetical protein